MVRILQVIFSLDAVARELRIPRHALVFFEQLGGVAALTVVLTVPRLAAEVRSPLSPTAAPAAALTIVDQNFLFPNKEEVAPWPEGSGARSDFGGAASTLSFRSARQMREMNGRLRRGLGQDALISIPGPAH
jgi:hypothetical protein